MQAVSRKALGAELMQHRAEVWMLLKPCSSFPPPHVSHVTLGKPADLGFCLLKLKSYYHVH